MESAEYKKDWDLSIEDERKLWDDKLINRFIPVPKTCKFCKKGIINLRKNNSIINPYLAKCNNYKCNTEKYLRIWRIFQHQNKTPSSVLYKIIELWILDELNGTKIANRLKEIYNFNSMKKQFIYNYLNYLRVIIANYIWSKYCLDPLSVNNAQEKIVVDESLFTHVDGIAQWVVGLINLSNNDIRK